MTYKSVAINPGATSTKLAYYEDDRERWKDEILYTNEAVKSFAKIFDQFEMRIKDILACLDRHGVTKDLDVVVGRGGLVGPVKPGGIVVDDALIDRLEHHPVLEHASNLGAKLAQSVAQAYGKPETKAYIYDPVTVDSMSEIARITGLKEISRKSVGHHLNMRAVAIRAAADINKTYQSANVIVVHMGGGCSASAHQQGIVVDFVSDDEYMFSAERSGGFSLKEILPLIQEMGVSAFAKYARSQAGLQSHYGTKDLREVEAMIQEGKASFVPLAAMGLGIAKCIAALAATLKGQVDVICMTGGMAYSDILCKEVKDRVEFIAPFVPYPGEFELLALVKGGLRILKGEEVAHKIEEMV